MGEGSVESELLRHFGFDTLPYGHFTAGRHLHDFMGLDQFLTHIRWSGKFLLLSKGVTMANVNAAKLPAA
jgi:hypothetical protein